VSDPRTPRLAVLFRLTVLALLPAFLLTACDDAAAPADSGAPDSAADTGPVDAGPAPACLSPADALMIPSPMWERPGTEGLRAPEGDVVLGLLAPRPAWATNTRGLDGWPRRPTFVVPLWGAASDVDPTAIKLYGIEDEALTEHAVPLDVFLEDDGGALIVVPTAALPSRFDRAILSVGADAIIGAVPVPGCGEDGSPHEDYADAAALVPADTALAFSFPLSHIEHELPALYESLIGAGVLSVTSAGAIMADTLGDDAPSADVLSALRSPIADGLLSTPAYQDDEGVFVVDAAGLPTSTGTEAPGFTVLLPATGSAPYPFVLYQHGGSQHRHSVTHAAGPLLEAGFALIAIDLPFHGDRASEGGGTDLDILVFDEPLRSRDNLRQASADHLAVLTHIDVINEALMPLYGEAVLDPSRPHYMGLSLGGFTGTMTFASAPTLDAAALFVAGGGYQEVLTDGFFNLLLADIIRSRGAARHGVLSIIELLLNGADPLAYAGREESLGRARPLLLFEAIDDPLVPNNSTDRWAQAFGVSVATPLHHEIPGLTGVVLPHTGAPARVLVQAPMDEVAVTQRHGALIEQGYSQELVAHCFTGLAAGGPCEVLDTGFAEH